MNRCDKCGRKAVARINNRFWLCADCAEKATIASLAFGEPVVEAVKGEPRYMTGEKGALISPKTRNIEKEVRDITKSERPRGTPPLLCRGKPRTRFPRAPFPWP